MTTGPIPSVSGLVAAWVAEDLSLAHGDPVGSWVDRVGGYILSSSGSNRPTFNAAPGPGGPRGRPAVSFLAANDQFLGHGSALTSAASGSVIVAGTITNGTAWSSSNPSSGYRAVFGLQAGGDMRVQRQNTAPGGQVSYVYSTYDGSARALEWASNGSAWNQRQDNIPLTVHLPPPSTFVTGSNTGQWFGSVASRDNFTLGCVHTPTSINPSGRDSSLTGHISVVLVIDGALSPGDRSALYAWILGPGMAGQAIII